VVKAKSGRDVWVMSKRGNSLRVKEENCNDKWFTRPNRSRSTIQGRAKRGSGTSSKIGVRKGIRKRS